MSAQLPQIISSLNPNPEPIAEKDEQITGLGRRSEIPDWLRETENLPTTPENQSIYNESGENTPTLIESTTIRIAENKEKIPTLAKGEKAEEQSLQNRHGVDTTTLYADDAEARALIGYGDAHNVSSIV